VRLVGSDYIIKETNCGLRTKGRPKCGTAQRVDISDVTFRLSQWYCCRLKSSGTWHVSLRLWRIARSFDGL